MVSPVRTGRLAPLLAAGVTTSVGLLGGCARQEAPTGGPEDRRPPVVITTTPAPFAVLEQLDGGVRFEFDERISERVSGGALETAVTVSPVVGEVRVKHSRRALTVEMEGGFVPGVVYRVTLQPVVSDMFGNQITDPFELVFSTGPEPVPTTVAGEVWDRTTGMPMADAVVLAEGEEGLVHQARTGRDGIFAFRYVEAGGLLLTAFEDQNRNAEADTAETQGAVFADLSVGDTLLVDIAVLEQDTAAAVLGDSEALDSVTVVLDFDDFLDTELDAAALEPTIVGPDGTIAIDRVFQEAGYEAWVEEVSDSLATLDSIDAANALPLVTPEPVGDTTVAADEVGEDVVPAPPDTVLAAVGGPIDPTVGAPRQVAPIRPRPAELRSRTGENPGVTTDGRRVLPGRRLVITLSEPIEYDVEYVVTIDGIVNINGLAGGGGIDTLVVTAPEDTATVDSLALDSLSADSSGVRVDAARVDTLAALFSPRPNRR
ncbi:MAG: Ig-like domain-containing protein [Gemmatimonadota bacterium]